MSDAGIREDKLGDARRILAGLKGAAVEIPTLGGLIKPLEERLERADRYHLEAEDAARAVKAARRTRDAHEMAALTAPDGDPVASAAEAQEALDEAEKRAEDMNRLANATVTLALSAARSAKGQIRREYRTNAPRLTRERLRRFEDERKAAVEAVQAAKKHIHRTVGAFGAVRGIATRLPEGDPMRELVAKSKFDLHSRRAGTNQPTMEGVLQYMDSVPTRLGYGNDKAPRGYPVVGSAFGEAVRLAMEEEEESAASSDE